MVSMSAYAVLNREDTIKPKQTSVNQSSLLMKQYCSWFIKDQKWSKLGKGCLNKTHPRIMEGKMLRGTDEINTELISTK